MEIPTAELAAKLSVPPRTLRAWAEAGLVPKARKVGGRWLFPAGTQVTRPRRGRRPGTVKGPP